MSNPRFAMPINSPIVTAAVAPDERVEVVLGAGVAPLALPEEATGAHLQSCPEPAIGPFESADCA